MVRPPPDLGTMPARRPGHSAGGGRPSSPSVPSAATVTGRASPWAPAAAPPLRRSTMSAPPSALHPVVVGCRKICCSLVLRRAVLGRVEGVAPLDALGECAEQPVPHGRHVRVVGSGELPGDRGGSAGRVLVDDRDLV